MQQQFPAVFYFIFIFTIHISPWARTAAALALPRYGGLNYVHGINEVLKQKKMSHCIMMYNARAKILNDSASFTTKCIMVTTRVTENV